MNQTLLAALQARGYDQLTPVQEAVTAPGLAGRDLLVSAQTGSGKTVGFGLAIAPTVLGEADAFGPAAAPLALVIAPTRELALQVRRELDWLYAGAGAVLASCVGGMDFRTERRALEQGAHLVVGTPGRLCDHLRRGTLDLSAIRAVVLDEADEMLDLGFREDLETILEAAPAGRQTLMFSATVPPEIAALARSFQREAQRITTQSGARQHADIDYRAVMVAEFDAEPAITNLLRFHEAPGAIIFANTRAAVARLVSRLTNRGFAVVSLSGELSQTERTHALQAMRDGRARICVATDVAARGIDLPNLDLVIHAELPLSEETLLHRSGRTGRAGRKGVSALIVPPKARGRAERLLKAAKLEAAWEPGPSAEAVLAKDEARLLADPVWSEPMAGDEAQALRKVLAERSPEQVALAMIRLWRGRRSAPEDLLPVAPRAAPGAGFGPGRWFHVPIGRSRKASPKWLMPKFCEAGGITRAEIGAIRIGEEESYVEVAESVIDQVIREMGPEMEVAEGLVATLIEGVPDLAAGRGERAPREGRFGAGPRGRFGSERGERPGGKGGPGAKRGGRFERFGDAPVPRHEEAKAPAVEKPRRKPVREGSEGGWSKPKPARKTARLAEGFGGEAPRTAGRDRPAPAAETGGEAGPRSFGDRRAPRTEGSTPAPDGWARQKKPAPRKPFAARSAEGGDAAPRRFAPKKPFAGKGKPGGGKGRKG